MVAPKHPVMTDEQALRIFRELACMSAVELMTDVQLADRLRVLMFDMANQLDYYILSELVARFEKMAGIERDEEGKVVPNLPSAKEKTS